MSSFQFTLTQIQGCRAGSRLDHSAGSLPVPEHGRSSTTKVKCDTSEARATLLSMCHHFHDKRVRAGVSGVMEHAYFEPLPREEWCDYCAGRRHVATLAPNLTAIYCISLQEQPHRTAKAATQFHALGLCRDVLFYRPVRGCDTDRAIWDSHRAVAADAVARALPASSCSRTTSCSRGPGKSWCGASRPRCAPCHQPGGDFISAMCRSKPISCGRTSCACARDAHTPISPTRPCSLGSPPLRQ